jgi:hypothetical protein
MTNPRDIGIMVEGYTYLLPQYEVTNEGLSDYCSPQVIRFCKGDKSDETKFRQHGLFVESLLEAVANRLKAVNTGELATRETSVAITKIEEAIMWLEKRSNERKLRGVEGTYQK